MIYQLLKTAIAQNNAFMTKEMITLQIQFFLTTGKITQVEADELTELISPKVVESPTCLDCDCVDGECEDCNCKDLDGGDLV